MSSQTADSFITEVATRSQPVDVNLLLEPVRTEHTKVMRIADAFGKKVELLTDKQRADYVQAYEHHMHDVQKELHILREKAQEIANDKTKEEKILKLGSDQKFYRSEAVRLDFETSEFRNKLRALTSKSHMVERERDWLLSKLRKAKKRFRSLRREYNTLNGRDADEDGEMSLLSYDSSQTIDVQPIASTKTDAFSSTINTRRLQSTGYVMNEDSSFQPTYDGRINSSSTFNPSPIQRKRGPKKATRELAQLVQSRVKHEALRNFVADCLKAVNSDSWSKIADRPRSIEALVSNGLELIETSKGSEITRESEKFSILRTQLAKELALIPEVYYVLSDMMTGIAIGEDGSYHTVDGNDEPQIIAYDNEIEGSSHLLNYLKQKGTSTDNMIDDDLMQYLKRGQDVNVEF